MNGTSAETYLRRCAEDHLRVALDDHEQSGQLRERARALVMVGLLDREVANGVLSAYAQARALRGFPDYGVPMGSIQQPAAKRQRVCGCSGEVKVSGATVFPRLVVLGAQRTRLAVSLRPTGPSGSPQFPGHLGFGGPPTLTLRDDRRHSVSAEFSGGGDGSGDSRGWYTAEPGLSPETEWIEINRTRFVLRDADAGAKASVENLLPADPSVEQRAARYLEHFMDSAYSSHEPISPGVVADAFVDCGALRRDAPIVEQAHRLDENPMVHPMARPHRALRTAHRALHTAQRALRASRKGSVLVGVTTPPFAGVGIAVTELRWAPNGFSVEIEGYGSIDVDHVPGAIDAPRLAFAAADDVGNTYRGMGSQYGFGGGDFYGTIEFDQPLDARASTVDLIFSTEAARAVVRIPLESGAGR